jgi:TonB family protein
MKWSRRFVRLVQLASILTLYASAAFSQDLKELDATAKGRIELARASIATVKMLDERNETISQAEGFLIRKDLIATDLEIDRNSRLQVTFATEAGAIRVISSGNYFLPYVLVETQAEISPLSLGDSERVAVNDPVYMLSESGTIVGGRVTGSTTIKNIRAFSMSLPINANNKGAPVFDRHGEVIGIATKSPDAQSASLAWPSQLLATLKHLGEPGVGAGRGDGPQFGVGAAPGNTDNSTVTRVDTKPVPLSRPTPRYTEAARANGVQGSVLVRVLVGEDGNVKSVRVVRGLPDGLTEEAITAARQTKFKPAMKDGKPVPFWVGLEINFNIR